jgi:hypothetical protein
MKKAVIAAVVVFVLFAFSVPGAMAQTWTWSDPYPYVGANPLVKIAADSSTGNLYGIDSNGDIVVPGLGLQVTGVAATAGTIPPVADMTVSPVGIVYVIGATAVGTWDPGTNTYDTTMTQPLIPTGDVGGTYLSLAVGKDGTLNVLYQGLTEQYILVGTPPVIAEQGVISFRPGTLNVRSRGNWVSVHIQLPGDLDESLIDIRSVRITEIAVYFNDPTTTEIYTAPGAPWKVEPNDLGVQVLKVKFIRYNKKGGPALDEQSLSYQLKSIMTGAHKGKYPVTLAIEGQLTTGEWFTGTATFNANVTRKLP